MNRFRRCFGITGNIRNLNLHRCQRTGNWWLFCHEHWKQPVYWLLIGIITLVAIVADFSGFINLIKPPIVVSPTSLEVVSGYEQRRSGFVVYNTRNRPYYDIWIQLSLEMNGLERKQVSISEPDPAVNSYPFVKEGDPVPFGVAGLDKNGNDAFWVVIWSIPPNGKREYVIDLVEGVKLTESSNLKAEISVSNFDHSSTIYVSRSNNHLSTQFINKGENFNEIILTWKGGIPKYIMYNPFERGKKYLNEKKYSLAIEEFDKTLEIKPDFYPAYYDRGSAHSGRGNYDLAIADFDSVLKLNPKFYPAYYMRRVAYKLKGEKDHAVSDFREVLKSSNHPEILQHTRKHLQELLGQ